MLMVTPCGDSVHGAGRVPRPTEPDPEGANAHATGRDDRRPLICSALPTLATAAGPRATSTPAASERNSTRNAKPDTPDGSVFALPISTVSCTGESNDQNRCIR